MFREWIVHRIRPFTTDAVLATLSIGASLVYYSGIEEYLNGRYGSTGVLEAMAVLFAQLLCMMGLPLVILVRLFWRCRKDGIRGLAIRTVIIAATLAPMFLLAEPAEVTHRDKMRLRGFASWYRSQGPDVAAIREWLKTSRLPEGHIEYADCPPAVKMLHPHFIEILKEGSIELLWHQRGGPGWGIIITPTEDFPKEEYRLRMAAGVYTVVRGNGVTMRYQEYMVQLSPGVYAWLRPEPGSPATFPSEGS